MSTKRAIIGVLRDKLKERNADSTYTNQFLYAVLSEHAKWLIRREVSAGRIYSNNSLFQTLSCLDVIETSTVEECCPVKTNCKIFRTKNKLPEMWIDTDGPIVSSVTSVDGSTDFFYTTAIGWSSKKKDPYQRMSNMKYSFFADNYIWFPEHNPHKINVTGFFVDDISNIKSLCEDCENEDKPCTKFLDAKFQIPGWLEAELLEKAVQSIAGVTKRLQEDEDINKNPTRKN